MECQAAEEKCATREASSDRLEASEKRGCEKEIYGRRSRKLTEKPHIRNDSVPDNPSEHHFKNKFKAIVGSVPSTVTLSVVPDRPLPRRKSDQLPSFRGGCIYIGLSTMN